MNLLKFTSKQTLIIVLLLGLTLGFTGFVISEAVGTSGPERMIVTFEEGEVVNEEARTALEDLGGRVLKDLTLVNGAVVLVPEQAIPALGSIAGVKTVEKDAKVFALAPPGACSPWPDCKNNDEEEDSDQPAETLEWGVDRIDAELAWSTSRGALVKVAIIDTGIDKDHVDLAANLKSGINFVAPTTGAPWTRVADPNKWDDDNGHGTHVAGIVAAVDNDIGVVGTAPEAHLYGVKVLDKNGSGYLSDVIDGIEWAIENDMEVINLSLGTDSDSQSLHDAVDQAYSAGIITIAAAGNSGDGDGSTNEVIYPAKYSSVVAVSAIAEDDSTPTWSSEGEEVELAAPGVDIRSTWKDGTYETKSGTSMASPHTAGTVALILATPVRDDYDVDSDGVWDPSEVRSLLQDTADDLGPAGEDNFYGHGLTDAEESVTGEQTSN